LFTESLNLFLGNDKQTIEDAIEFKDIHDNGLEKHIGEKYANILREELELVNGVYHNFNINEYLAGNIAPVFFGSALNNFGVRELLDCFIQIAPSPKEFETIERIVHPLEEKFSGFVFKIHANMDPNHRDRIAFLRICTGTFKRNTGYLHVRQGKQLKFSTPTAFMAEKKSIIDEAFPGDVVGLHDTGNFKIGDTMTEGENLHFKGIPSFSPELFRYIENADPLKSKQLAKGIDQLMDEGVAQLFISKAGNRKIIGTVGALQFEVLQYRLLHEYGAACKYEPINLYKACWMVSKNKVQLEDFRKRKYNFLAEDKHGREVFLADSQYSLQMAQEKFQDITFHFTSEF
jgi:peptide chain release factor 3